MFGEADRNGQFIGCAGYPSKEYCTGKVNRMLHILL